MAALRHVMLRSGAALVDAVYPPRCAGCGRRGGWVCVDCEATLTRFEKLDCQRCGQPDGSRCICAEVDGALARIRSAAWYEGWIREAIGYFKYEGERARSGHLAAMCAHLLDDFEPEATLAPVPLHASRLRSRGYNQSELLATRLAGMRRCRVETALLRVIATRPQVGLQPEERAVNVKDAFSVAPGAVAPGRTFILVDDVFTTGATLGECAKALRAAGASWVGALTVARSGPH